MVLSSLRIASCVTRGSFRNASPYTSAESLPEVPVMLSLAVAARSCVLVLGCYQKRLESVSQRTRVTSKLQENTIRSLSSRSRAKGDWTAATL